VVTSPLDDDAAWRRPPADQRPDRSAPATPQGPAEPAGSGYTGPPRATPPPAGWRPPLVVQVPPPRTMPVQDLDRLDAAEEQARTLTYGVAMIAGAIMLVLMLVVCGRALF
jgi:hypothetical protein